MFIKSALLAAGAIALAAASAQAAPVASGAPAEQFFLDRVTAANETAVLEIRGGDGTRGAEYELDARSDAVAGSRGDGPRDVAIVPGQATDFTVMFDALTDSLSISVGRDLSASSGVFTDAVSFAGAGRFGETRSLFVRAFGGERSGKMLSATVSNLALNGTDLGISALSSTNSDDEFLMLSGIDFSAPFALTGQFALDGFNLNQRVNSSAAVQFKFTDVAAVPVPAAGLMLLAGLGGLGAARRLRR